MMMDHWGRTISFESGQNVLTWMFHRRSKGFRCWTAGAFGSVCFSWRDGKNYHSNSVADEMLKSANDDTLFFRDLSLSSITRVSDYADGYMGSQMP